MSSLGDGDEAEDGAGGVDYMATTGRTLFGLANVGGRGLVDSLDVAKARAGLEGRGIDIQGFPEHWRGRGERVRKKLQLQSTEEEREQVEGLLGEDWQWVERCRLKGWRGGVGLAVRKAVGIATVLEDMSSEGMLWVRVDLTGGGGGIRGGGIPSSCFNCLHRGGTDSC